LLIQIVNKKICLKERKSKHTNTRKETTKVTKENNTRTKHKWKRAECDHVKKKAEKSSEAESFKHKKINILHT
jgi:hypothetical protein